MIAAYAYYTGAGGRFDYYFIGKQQLLSAAANLLLVPQAKPWASNAFAASRLLAPKEFVLYLCSVFEYFYVDASNFKAWGHVLLHGSASPDVEARLKQCFESETFFIAEQLGLPPLYAPLWALSGGPTEADHIWHAFHQLRRALLSELDGPVFDTVDSFTARVAAVESWDGRLSPHWGS